MAASKQPYCVSQVAARLPKELAGANAFLLELALDEDGAIVEVSTSLSLPAYAALLRSMLVGLHHRDVANAVQALPALLKGPLLRPTIAALLRAAGAYDDGAGGAQVK